MKWFETHKKEILADFIEFLRRKSISADPAYANDVLQCCKWLEVCLKRYGLSTEVWETSGYPVIFASSMSAGPDAPTVLIYHHYDVQPVDPIELWESDPFEPEIRDGYIYARGAQDNKGQCFYSIAAIRAFLECGASVNVKVIIEGEEEIGSGGLTAILSEKKEALAADHLLIIDTDIPGADVPGVTLGVRGVGTMEVSCRGSISDLHSGLFGGIAYNPNRALAELLARCWDEKGHVAIPGFYDGAIPLSEMERAALDFSTELDAKGVMAFAQEEGCSRVEQNWVRPTLEINGMWGGYTGEGYKTVIPARAQAKLSVRIVPGQNPERVLRAIGEFLKKNAAPGIEVSVHYGEAAAGIRTAADSLTAKAVAQAYETVFGKRCRKVLCGASIPITPLLAEASGASFVLMGMGLPEDGIHAPNERFGLDRFEKGFAVVVKALELLGEK